MQSAEEQNWAAVANKINERMAILELTQAELAARADVSLSAVRELRTNKKPRNHSPKIVGNVSEALGLDRSYLNELAWAQQPAGDDRLSRMEDLLTSIVDQLGILDAKLNRVIDIVFPNQQ